MSQTVFRISLGKGLDGLQATKEPIPIVGKYELLVKVRSVSLNGRDVAIANSTYPLPVKDGVVPCSDMAGEVVQVGDLVNGFAIGDSVISPLNPLFLYGPLLERHGSDTFGGLRDGMLREYITLPAHAMIKLPKSSHSLAHWAAVVQAGATVWNAFYGNTPLKPGDTVLILGTGGVSLMALIIAKAAGATTIITSSSDKKLERVKSEIGVDYTINYKTFPDWAAEVQRITNGQGANQIIEISGVGTILQSLNSVARAGVISVIGFLTTVSQDKMADVTMLTLIKGCIVRGVQGGSKQQLEEAVNFIGSRELSVPVDKIFKFNRDDIIMGLKYLESGEHVGKVCINLD